MREFKEFVATGIIKKRGKNEARAKSLVDAAERRKIVMEKYLPLNSETSIQVIEECYDVIRELLEAKLIKEGYKTYSHEAVVSYLKEMGFSEDKVVFLDELRKVRHGTKYYGEQADEDYARKVKNFLIEIYSKLMGSI